MMGWISLNKAAEKAGIDRKNARVKLLNLEKKHSKYYKKLVRKSGSYDELKKPEIVMFFQTDFRKYKIKPFLENLVSKSKSSDPQNFDLKTTTKKSIKNALDINIEKEKNTKREKTGGRQKGTPNRITNDIRKRLKDIILDEIENIGPDLKLSEPKDRLNYIPKVLPYVLPKFNPIDKDPDQIPEWKKKFESMSLAQKREALRKLNTKKKNDKKKKK